MTLWDDKMSLLQGLCDALAFELNYLLLVGPWGDEVLWKLSVQGCQALTSNALGYVVDLLELAGAGGLSDAEIFEACWRELERRA